MNHYEILKHCIKKIGSKPFKFEESWFQSELYYQLRKFYPMGNEVGVSPNTFKRDLSVPDFLPMKDWVENGLNLENNRVNFYRYPDLIIHNLTSRNNRENQEIVIEIKKYPTIDQIRNDISKLIVFCHGRLKFKKGIFIIYNNDKNLLEVPNINEILRQFPEIEVWIARPNSLPMIYCSTNLIP